jgi:tRNA nucleotidyltransferase (CCA-adding enzyme)
VSVRTDGTDKTDRIEIPEYALGVMRRLREAGEQVYIVGGCVRDAFLGNTPNDYDMTVSCPPERTLEILRELRTIPTGLKHGTITAISEGNPIEITTFRVDGDYKDSRRPDSVSFTRRIEDDLSRRDFTVNAMAYSPWEGTVDLFGGREDLEAKIIRAVGDPAKRFEEDALRIMRAFRFSARLGFTIDEATLTGAYARRDGLANIARERIGAEFIRLLCSSGAQRALLLMAENGITEHVTGGYMPNERTLSALSRLPEDDEIRLGVFLLDADGETARGVIDGLRYSNRLKSHALLIAEHAHKKTETARDATLLRGVVGDETAIKTVTVSAALGISSAEAVALVKGNRAPSRINELAVGGEELLALGFSGREVGRALRDLLERVIDEPSLNEREILIGLAREMRKK